MSVKVFLVDKEITKPAPFLSVYSLFFTLDLLE